jgi:archaemetzincin
MLRILSSLLVCLFLVSCSAKRNNNASKKNKEDIVHTVAILPFTGADSNAVKEIKKGLESRLNVTVTVLPGTALPASAFYPPRQRYVADSLLDYLNTYNNRRYEKIIGVTSSDISTKKGEHINFGVMGLGFCPGGSCVISSFRVKRTAKNNRHFHRRMVILALHELGHTYSIEHCPDTACLMKDAEGKMNLDNGQVYCNDCKSVLLKKGLLAATIK